MPDPGNHSDALVEFDGVTLQHKTDRSHVTATFRVSIDQRDRAERACDVILVKGDRREPLRGAQCRHTDCLIGW
jgi:hypothetical protein